MSQGNRCLKIYNASSRFSTCLYNIGTRVKSKLMHCIVLCQTGPSQKFSSFRLLLFSHYLLLPFQSAFSFTPFCSLLEPATCSETLTRTSRGPAKRFEAQNMCASPGQMLPVSKDATLVHNTGAGTET